MFGEDRIGTVAGDLLDSEVESVYSLRKGGSGARRCGGGLVEIEIASSGDEKASKLYPSNARVVLVGIGDSQSG